MTLRNRVLSFGAAGLLIVLGLIAEPVLGGIAGEATAIGLLSLGGIAIASLIFLEVGLSEDNARERDLRAARALRARGRPRPRRRRPQ
jgi:hypothetical protein